MEAEPEGLSTDPRPREPATPELLPAEQTWPLYGSPALFRRRLALLFASALGYAVLLVVCLRVHAPRLSTSQAAAAPPAALKGPAAPPRATAAPPAAPDLAERAAPDLAERAAPDLAERAAPDLAERAAPDLAERAAPAAQVAELQAQIDQVLRQRIVAFAPDSVDLTAEGRAVLEEILPILRKAEGMHIEVAGHTDNIGPPADNQVLSARRAAAVQKFLIEQGLPAERTSSVGYGARRPIADNATPAGRRQNRRIEFVLKHKEKEK